MTTAFEEIGGSIFAGLSTNIGGRIMRTKLILVGATVALAATIGAAYAADEGATLDGIKPANSTVPEKVAAVPLTDEQMDQVHGGLALDIHLAIVAPNLFDPAHPPDPVVPLPIDIWKGISLPRL